MYTVILYVPYEGIWEVEKHLTLEAALTLKESLRDQIFIVEIVRES